MEYISHYDSPLGRILLASDGHTLTGLWFEENTPSLGAFFSPEKDKALFESTKEWLFTYFSGKDPCFTPLLTMKGSAFRKRVWQILLSVPYGKTVTYGEIAHLLARERGTPMSAQAVGNAVGHNRIALIIPCHRVLGARGRLTGYAAGTAKKKALLELEGSLEQFGSAGKKG